MLTNPVNKQQTTSYIVYVNISDCLVDIGSDEKHANAVNRIFRAIGKE
jgi:hypothetical protein